MTVADGAGSNASTDVDTLPEQHARRDRISVLSENSIEALTVFWGALRAEVTVDPIRVAIRENHADQIPADSRRLRTGAGAWVAFGTGGAAAAAADDLFARPRPAPSIVGCTSAATTTEPTAKPFDGGGACRGGAARLPGVE